MPRLLLPLLRLCSLLILLGLGALPAAPVQARNAPAESQVAAPITEVSLSSLPAEARRTLSLIRQGGPFPHAKDGVVFGNREKLLPRQRRGHYTEYTVETPGARNRGARRIVVGGDPRTSLEVYYSDDHYQSFKRIRE